MKDNHVSIRGNVATDPQMRTINGERTMIGFRLAATPRYRDRQSGRWVDGRTTWVNVSCWGHLADNVAASVGKGTPVIVSGKLVSSRWTTEQGEPRSRVEVEAETLGVDLQFGTVDFRRVNWSEPVSPGREGIDELAEEVERAGLAAELSGFVDDEDADEPEAIGSDEPVGV